MCGVQNLLDTGETKCFTEVNQLPYEISSQLEQAITDFVDYYNYRRYHKALGNVAPADVLYGRRNQILERRKEVQAQTINRRRNYNRDLREVAMPSDHNKVFGL